jgi:hypothetical protein
MTSDRGSNEVASRNMWIDLLASSMFIFFLDSDCFEHALHLICLGGLKLIDDYLKNHRNWKYYSSVAIIANVLRDLAADVYDTWVRMHGAQSAQSSVRTLFPKANSARWGQVHLLEGRFRLAGFSKLSEVLRTVLAVKVAKKSKTEGNTDMNPNVLAIEQTAEYTKQQGKWRHHAGTTIADPLLEGCVEAVFRTREPLIHLSNFIKVRLNAADVEKHGSNLAQMVNFKAAQIDSELDDLFTCISSLEHHVVTVILYWFLDFGGLGLGSYLAFDASLL